MLLEALKYDNRIFGLDPQLVFQVAFQMLAIFILFLAASYLLLDPVRKILNDRKERVMKEQKEAKESREQAIRFKDCLLYTSPSPRDRQKYRMPSSA